MEHGSKEDQQESQCDDTVLLDPSHVNRACGGSIGHEHNLQVIIELAEDGDEL